MSRADQILQAREPIGWKLGLERMRRLCSLLGMPQNRFASVHVVGTNGKTSVARMTVALLEAHGVMSGAYLSPHISSWRERILVGGEPISEAAFERALERAEQAALAADRAASEEEGPVTQFELVTAAAFWAFAEARVEVAVIEAGLGGRLDATNVIPSKVTVLTSIGLDHTEWLGETVEEIAAEKLAVLRDHTTLIRGEVPAEVEPVIEREAERRSARVIGVDIQGMAGAVPPGYQARNLALACGAVSELLGRFDVGTLTSGRFRVAVPGRAQFVDGEPPTIFDAAHNPDGARALAELLREAEFLRLPRRPWQRGSRRRPLVCCLAILAEKDAGAMIEALAGVCDHFVCTEIPEEAIRGSGRPIGESHGADRLVELCRSHGAAAEAIPDPLVAWARTEELARERGGVALATGSHYLLSCLWTKRHAASS